MNATQKRYDGHITVRLTVSRWTGETLMVEEFSGTPSVVRDRLRWLAENPRLHLPKGKAKRRAPPNHLARGWRALHG